MDKDTVHHAMRSVLEDMGRAAREGRARRYTKRPAKGVEVTMGELTLEPNGAGADVEVDPVKRNADQMDQELSEGDAEQLAKDLEIQR